MIDMLMNTAESKAIPEKVTFQEVVTLEPAEEKVYELYACVVDLENYILDNETKSIDAENEVITKLIKAGQELAEETSWSWEEQVNSQMLSEFNFPLTAQELKALTIAATAKNMSLIDYVRKNLFTKVSEEIF